MAICSFLGDDSRIYDVDICCRVQTAVDQLIAENEEVNFLIHLHGGFYDCCLRAVLNAKARQPQNVTITLILNEECYQEYVEKESAILPYCMFDKVIVPPISPRGKAGQEAPISSLRLMRWMILNSTHLISGLYEAFFETENRFLELARRTLTLKIISLTNPETEEAIIENISLLPDRKREIYQNQIAKHDLEETAKALGITKNRAIQILHDGRRILHKNMVRRYYQMIRQLGRGQKLSCSVFAFGKPTYEALCRMEYIVSALNSFFNVQRFYIEQAQTHIAFTYVLKRLSLDPSKLFLTGVTDKEIDLESENAASNYCDPCNAVIRVTRDQCANEDNLGIIASMIELSDFCICDLSSTPLADEIREYAACEGGTVLLDTSKECIREEWQSSK